MATNTLPVHNCSMIVGTPNNVASNVTSFCYIRDNDPGLSQFAKCCTGPVVKDPSTCQVWCPYDKPGGSIFDFKECLSVDPNSGTSGCQSSKTVKSNSTTTPTTTSGLATPTKPISTPTHTGSAMALNAKSVSFMGWTVVGMMLLVTLQI